MILAVSFAVVAGLVPVFGGRLSRLATLQLRWLPLLYSALAVQVVIIAVLPASFSASNELHLASYVIALAFLLGNRAMPGMIFIAAGATTNVAAIAANGGVMPASPRALEVAGLTGAVDHFANSAAVTDPRLAWLGDVFAIPAWFPFANVFSVGDVLLLIGGAVMVHVVCGSRLAGGLTEDRAADPTGTPLAGAAPEDTPTATSATGGSATSQATSLDQRSWTPNRWVSWTILAVTTAGPVLAGILAVRLGTRVVARPESVPLHILWFGGLLAASSGAAYGGLRLVRKLAPLRTLFTMSLVFPDHAPSRFRTAMRSRTGRTLQRDVGTSVGPDQAAAEELVDLLVRMNRHDRMTRGHTERVRAYSVMLGEEINLSRSDLDKLNWAALAHDLGKLDVPAEILSKPDQPTEAEWEVLRGHPAAAEAYAEALRPWLGDWVATATQHHERYDGTGYPLGLSGTGIALSARIVAIADAFDVMTATRSYKKALPAEQARAELVRNSGTQFDPGLVRAFVRVSVGNLRWVIGPLGWLANLPALLRVPIAGLTNSPGIAAVAAASVAAVLPAAALPAHEAAPERPAVSAAVVTNAEAPLVVVPTTDTTTSSPPPVPAPIEPARVEPTPPATTPTTAAPSTPTTSPATGPIAATSPTTTPAGSPPVAVDDAYRITSPGWVVLQVHMNDLFAPDTKAAPISVVAPPQLGTLLVQGLNVKYMAAQGASGTDTFVYQICNIAGVCDTATVTLTVAIEVDDGSTSTTIS